MWKKSIGIICILAGSLVLLFVFSKWYEKYSSDHLNSPVTANSQFNFLSYVQKPTTSSPKVVLGFLPYWNLDEVVFQPELTQLAYFSLTLEADGTIRTREGNGLEPGYRTFNSNEFQNVVATWQDERQGPELHLVITQFENETIAAFLNDQEARATFLETLDSLVRAYPITGLNIDFEPTGVISEQTRTQFTEFMQELYEHKSNNYSEFLLSVDVYASAVDKPNLWDIPNLAPVLDHLVIMAYDFHRRSSPAAGPVAPLFGGSQLWEHDISIYLNSFLKHVDRKKLLLGIPFYGYEWQTISTDPQAQTFPNSGATASYRYVHNLLNTPPTFPVQQWWNEAALSPYITYQQDGKNYTIYYDDARSLSYKLQLVQQLDLGGIAIWALGYEGATRELWDVIQSQL